jgi:hypothetical protein
VDLLAMAEKPNSPKEGQSMTREERNAAVSEERLAQAREVLRLQKDEGLSVQAACERAGMKQANYGNWRSRAIASLKPKTVRRKNSNAARNSRRPTLHTMEVPTAPIGKLIAFVGQPAEVLAAVRAM